MVPESPEVVAQVGRDLVDGWRRLLEHEDDTYLDPVLSDLMDTPRAPRVAWWLGLRVHQRMVTKLGVPFDHPIHYSVRETPAEEWGAGVTIGDAEEEPDELDDGVSRFMTLVSYDRPQEAAEAFEELASSPTLGMQFFRVLLALEHSLAPS